MKTPTTPTKPTPDGSGLAPGTHVDIAGTTHADSGTPPHIDIAPVHVDTAVHIDSSIPGGSHVDSGAGHVDSPVVPHIDAPAGPHVDTLVPPHVDVTTPAAAAKKRSTG